MAKLENLDRKVFMHEEDEAVRRDSASDLAQFRTTCSNIESVVSEINELKKQENSSTVYLENSFFFNVFKEKEVFPFMFEANIIRHFASLFLKMLGIYCVSILYASTYVSVLYACGL